LFSFEGYTKKTEVSLMAKKRKGASSEKLSDIIVKGMQEKKATNIVVLDLRKVKNAVADFFILCSGSSDKQLDAIADSIDAEVFKALQENPWHIEGKNNKEWMLLDYIDVVAHVFRKDRREFYALEKLWGDADIIEIDTSN
jgi:ribosome-associated protein